jgi:ubiquinone/menaquinone biosynthesis C-methylase UbiE
MDLVKQYWDKKYLEKNEIWGYEPSEAAVKLLEYLWKNGIHKGNVLDVACGYGRDAIFFAKNGYKVKGIDISSVAIDIAKSGILDNIEFIVGDLMEMPFESGSFDVVFGNYILHLFPYDLRRKMLEECHRVLKQGGTMVLSVASIDDPDYGVGREVEKNCFVNSRGVTKFYYSKEAVNNEFTLFKVTEVLNIEEYHEHDSPHTHKSFLIITGKESAQDDQR